MAKGKGKRRIRLGKRIVEAMDIPQEALLDVPKITLAGRGHMLIENHRGVFEYHNETVRLHTVEGLLRIAGNELVLKDLSENLLYISGEIRLVEYESKE